MIIDELDRLVEKLDLERKVRLLTGATVWSTHAEPDIGLRAMVTSDGPVGVRGEGWDERSPSLTLPSATALAATWDDDLVGLLGGLLAAEARRKGVHVLLAPTLNLHRSPLGGRHFECYSEDPLLTGRIGAAYIRGVQAGGVAATAKHYVANDSETERLTLDARVDERTLRELYLAPFEAAVEAGVWAVMSAYNGVNGTTMSENPLLADPLKAAWGFDGVVVSDWGGVRSTGPAARAAQDLAMPGPQGPWGEALVAAVRAGDVPEAAIDDKVRRLLRLASRVGALTGIRGSRPPGGRPRRLPRPRGAGRPRPYLAEREATPLPRGPGPRPAHAEQGDHDPARALLRRAVAAGTVLLRNEGSRCPWIPRACAGSPCSGRTPPPPGSRAAAARVSSPSPWSSPLDGIRDALSGTAEVVHSPGVNLDDRPTPLGTATPATR